MTKGIQAIAVTRSHGVMKVQAIGRSARGVKFILKELPIKAAKTSDPDFKTEVKAAVDELMSTEE